MQERTYKAAAKALGVTSKQVKAALWWVEWKTAHASRRRDGLYIVRQERRLASSIKGKFNLQIAYLIRETAKLDVFNKKGVRVIERKSLSDDIKMIVDDLPEQEEIVAEITTTAAAVMQRGARTTLRSVRKLGELGISFNLKNQEAINYLTGVHDLQLSNRNGSITKTTKQGIIDIITDGIEDGATHTQLAKTIRLQGRAGTFSKSRSEMIAQDQMAKAYEEGNKIVANEGERLSGEKLLHSWVTVGDGKVTPECEENEAKGWIPADLPFPSGHSNPPRFPRCRCGNAYEFESTLRDSGQL